MLNRRSTLLLVDDSPEDLRLLGGVLVGAFDILTAESGEQAMQLCAAHKVDVVLLDVDMPGMDGYATCRALRAEYPTVNVMFLSAHDGLDEILRGYDAGGSDYLLKPFEPEILLGKINGALALVRNLAQLEIEKNEASGAFKAAIASMGDLGLVNHFLRESFKVSVSGDLARLLFECLQTYQLQACVQLRNQFSCDSFSSTGPISQLEIELLTRVAQTQTRFLARDRRIFINFSGVTLLVKNAPVEEDKIGRLRDALAIMLEGLNEKLLSLEKDRQIFNMLRADSRSNLLLLQELDQHLLEVEAGFGQLRNSNINLVERLVDTLQAQLSQLAVTEQDEEALLIVVERTRAEAQKLFLDAQSIGLHITRIKEKIHNKCD